MQSIMLRTIITEKSASIMFVVSYVHIPLHGAGASVLSIVANGANN